MIRKWIKKIIDDEMREMTDEVVCGYIEENIDTVAEKAVAKIGLDEVGAYMAEYVQADDIASWVSIDMDELVEAMDDISAQDVAAELNTSEIAEYVRDDLDYDELSGGINERLVADHLKENMDALTQILSEYIEWDSLAETLMGNGIEEEIVKHLDMQSIAMHIEYDVLAENLQDMGYKLVLAKQEEGEEE